MFLAQWRLADNARLYALGRLLFAIIALALLHVPLLALSRAIDVLRALCGLLFRLLITIRTARLLVHFVFIFHSCFLSSLECDVKWCLNYWMEERASVMSAFKQQLSNSQAAGFYAACGACSPPREGNHCYRKGRREDPYRGCTRMYADFVARGIKP